MDADLPDSGEPRPAKRPNPMRGRVASSGDTPASTGNVANIVTTIRILLAPVFVWMLLFDAGQFGWLRYVAIVLFLVAITTDGVDGYLARRRNLVTDVGVILDPIADKILTGGALVSLSILGELPWVVTVLILVREFGITALRLATIRSRVIPASWGGKWKTVLQAVAITLFLLAPWRFLGEWAGWFSWIVMGAAIALTLATGVDYLIRAWRLNRT